MPLISPCNPTQTCNVPLKWAIPAGVLNAFWGTVLPRMVAQAWMKPLWASNGDLFRHLNAGPGTPVQRFLARMGDFEVPNVMNPNPPFPLSSSAKVRFDKVAGYLALPDTIPIRFMAEGGYDFVLSDEGLDVFVPKRPEKPKHILDFYTFRRTGRRPIGTPIYLAGPNLATATESPTGPGQVIIKPKVVIEIVVGWVGLPFGNPVCLNQIGCMIRRLGVPWHPETDEEALGMLELLADPRRDNIPGGLPSWFPDAFTVAIRPTHLPRELITCIFQGFRCWQIEGSVYRGMMTEFPRLVAKVWLEDESGCPGSYQRLTVDGFEAREVFEEQMETMLPSGDQMDFCADGPGGSLPPNPPWTPPHWNPEDVMITNKGIYFPRLKKLEVALNLLPGATVEQKMNKICHEIAAGRAGNPVFTDSMRTERDE